MTTSECLLVSIEPGFRDGVTDRSADAARPLGLSMSLDVRKNDGEPKAPCCARCGCIFELGPPSSSFGAFGIVPNDLSRSSTGNSRFVGTVGRLGIKPGRTHCMLFGPPPMGALGALKPGLSGGA